MYDTHNPLSLLASELLRKYTQKNTTKGGEGWTHDLTPHEKNSLTIGAIDVMTDALSMYSLSLEHALTLSQTIPLIPTDASSRA